MKNLLNSIQVSVPDSNHFDLSHSVKTSCNMGKLVPVLTMEVVPGDKITLGAETLARLQPMVAPMMHRADIMIHYWFVPNRILWDHWEEWITNNNGDTPLPAHPYVTVRADNYTRLHDYMDIPQPIGVNTEQISPFPFAAYQKIFNEFYRDQNLLDDEVGSYTLVDGENDIAALSILRTRAWEHDYFTSNLPFAQKGEAVQMPHGTFNDVEVKSNKPGPGGTTLDGSPNDQFVAEDITTSPGVPTGNLYAETSQLTQTAATINELRVAFSLQRWLEKAARVGSRYVEYLRGFFGVRSSDQRMQRPEFIAGVKTPFVISEVLNTTGTDDRPQGDMAGHGLAYRQGSAGSYYAEEHGYIIGIMSILPRTGYQQGIPRHYNKYTHPTELYTPDFANIGEQATLKKEIYAFQGASGLETFGYLPRYTEYRTLLDRVSGDFRTTLAFWTMNRIFATPPQLNGAFISSDPTTRVFAVEDEDVDKVLVSIRHNISAVRKMPKYGTPLNL